MTAYFYHSAGRSVWFRDRDHIRGTVSDFGVSSSFVFLVAYYFRFVAHRFSAASLMRSVLQRSHGVDVGFALTGVFFAKEPFEAVVAVARYAVRCWFATLHPLCDIVCADVRWRTRHRSQ
jgi:hypothetical protein